MADESFPTINYVPIDHSGGNILEGLMQLYGAYKGAKQQQQGDQYLKANPPAPGVTNQGALDQWNKAQGGLETGARTTNYGADTGYRNALSAFMPQEEQIKQQGADASTAEAAARTTEAGTQQQELAQKGDPFSPQNSNDTLTRLANENNQLAERKNQAQEFSNMDKDRTEATQEKATATSEGQQAQLLEHYAARQNSGIPLSADEQNELSQLKQHVFKNMGVDLRPPAQVGGATSGALPTPDITSPGAVGAQTESQMVDQGKPTGILDALTGAKDVTAGMQNPGSITLPEIPKPKRQGGDAASTYQKAVDGQLKSAAQAYLETKAYEEHHGVVPGRTIDDRLEPNTRARILQYINSKMVPAGRAQQ